MNCFDPDVDRPRVRDLIGEEAENLVYKFCSIDRQMLEETVLSERTIRMEGYTMKHIHTAYSYSIFIQHTSIFIQAYSYSSW